MLQVLRRQRKSKDEQVYQQWLSQCDRAIEEGLAQLPAASVLPCDSLVCNHQPPTKECSKSLLRILSADDRFKERH